MCQQRTLGDGEGIVSNEKRLCIKDDKGILRFASRVRVPNVQELKDEIFINLLDTIKLITIYNIYLLSKWAGLLRFFGRGDFEVLPCI